MASIEIDIRDEEPSVLVFSGSSTFELVLGSVSVTMTMEQFDKLCEQMRAWIVEDSPAHTSEARDSCKWNQEDEGGECFGTSCGHHYQVIDADTDGLSFCVYCGGHLIAEKWRDEDEDAAMRQEGGTP